jgi:phage virion morphogenesis protein
LWGSLKGVLTRFHRRGVAPFAGLAGENAVSGIKLSAVLHDKEVKNLLARIQEKTGNLKPAYEIIGETVLESVRENFRQGGRPTPWKKSERAIRDSGQTLVDKGTLSGSITYEATKSKVVVGTNIPYAAIHHIGGTIPGHAVKAKRAKALAIPTPDGVVFRKSASIPKVEMPARPYLMVQDEDWHEMGRQLAQYLMKG